MSGDRPRPRVGGARPALVTRVGPVLRARPERVLARPFIPSRERLLDDDGRPTGVLARVLGLDEDLVVTTLAGVRQRFGPRHRDLGVVFAASLDRIAHLVPDLGALSEDRRHLLGAVLTNEYAVEGAALFNPSAVQHPDQSGLAVGQRRFVMSLRAVGEGHLSCVEFRTGVFGPGDEVRLDAPGRFVEVGSVRVDTERPGTSDSTYRVEFPAATALDARVLIPQTHAESHGMEDVRFVRFTGGDGTVSYRGTYTAYDGAQIAPHLIETNDFRRFTVSALSGPAASNKGLALFPRTVRGRYVALTRSNGESNGIASSADGHRWSSPTLLAGGGRPWQLVQSGNCGSPVETPAGWLVLTHGVGPVREYAIGALLLDLEDPTRVLGELREPLLRARADEREGYVPNVLYSCGSLLVGNRLLVPYGASDESVRFASVDLALLLGRLLADGPPGTTSPAATRVKSSA